MHECGRPTEHVHGALLTIAELLDARGASLGETKLPFAVDTAVLQGGDPGNLWAVRPW